MCDEFDYRILTMEQRDATMIVMSRAFCTQPLSLALPGTRKVTDTVQVFDWYMDECVKRQLSMIAIDTCSHRVAGACLLRDHTWRPQCEEYLKQWVENKERPTAAVTGAVLHAEKMACNKLPILEKCQDGDVIDIWCRCASRLPRAQNRIQSDRTNHRSGQTDGLQIRRDRGHQRPHLEDSGEEWLHTLGAVRREDRVLVGRGSGLCCGRTAARLCRHLGAGADSMRQSTHRRLPPAHRMVAAFVAGLASAF